MIRLYQFYNYSVGRSGEVFALCDEHVKTQKIPDKCSLNKIADKALYECATCLDIKQDAYEYELKEGE